MPVHYSWQSTTACWKLVVDFLDQNITEGIFGQGMVPSCSASLRDELRLYPLGILGCRLGPWWWISAIFLSCNCPVISVRMYWDWQVYITDLGRCCRNILLSHLSYQPECKSWLHKGKKRAGKKGPACCSGTSSVALCMRKGEAKWGQSHWILVET